MKTAKEAEKDYILQLNLANNMRDYFIENTKRILDDFQLIEQNYIESLKEFLKQNNLNQSNMFTAMQTNYDSILKVIIK